MACVSTSVPSPAVDSPSQDHTNAQEPTRDNHELVGNAMLTQLALGMPLDPSDAGMARSVLGVDLGHVRVFAGDGVAEAHGARGVCLGDTVHLASTAVDERGVDRQVLGHELVHAAQAAYEGPLGSIPQLETEAVALGGFLTGSVRRGGVRFRAPHTALADTGATEADDRAVIEKATSQAELAASIDVQRSASQIILVFPTENCVGYTAKELREIALVFACGFLAGAEADPAVIDALLDAMPFRTNLPDVITLDAVTDAHIPIAFDYFVLTEMGRSLGFADETDELMDSLSMGKFMEHFYAYVMRRHQPEAEAKASTDDTWQLLGIHAQVIATLLQPSYATLFVQFCMSDGDAESARLFFEGKRARMTDAGAMRELASTMYDDFLYEHGASELDTMLTSYILAAWEHNQAERERIDEEMAEAMGTAHEVGIGDDPAAIASFVTQNMDTTNSVEVGFAEITGGDVLEIDGHSIVMIYVSGNHVCYWDQHDGLVYYLGRAAFREWAQTSVAQMSGVLASEFIETFLIPLVTDPTALLKLVLGLAADLALELLIATWHATPHLVKAIIVDLMLESAQLALELMSLFADLIKAVVDVITSEEFAIFLDAVATAALFGPFTAAILSLTEGVFGEPVTARSVLAFVDEHVLLPLLELIREPLADLIRLILASIFPDNVGYYLEASIAAQIPVGIPLIVGEGTFVSVTNVGDGLFRLRLRGESEVGVGKGKSGKTGEIGGVYGEYAAGLQAVQRVIAFHEFEFPVVDDSALIALLVAFMGAETAVGIGGLFSDAIAEIDPHNYMSVTKYEVQSELSANLDAGLKRGSGAKDGGASTPEAATEKTGGGLIDRVLSRASLFGELALTHGFGIELQTTKWADEEDETAGHHPLEVDASLYVEAELVNTLPFPVPVPSGGAGIKATWHYGLDDQDEVVELAPPTASIYGKAGEMDIFQGPAYEAGLQFDQDAFLEADDIDEVLQSLRGGQIKYRFAPVNWQSRKWARAVDRQGKVANRLDKGYTQAGANFELYAHFEFGLDADDVRDMGRAIIHAWQAITEEDDTTAALVDVLESLTAGNLDGLPEGVKSAANDIYGSMSESLDTALLHSEKGGGVGTDGGKKGGKGDFHANIGVGMIEEYDLREEIGTLDGEAIGEIADLAWEAASL